MSLRLFKPAVAPPPPEPEPEPEPPPPGAEDCVTPTFVADAAIVPAFTEECE